MCPFPLGENKESCFFDYVGQLSTMYEKGGYYLRGESVGEQKKQNLGFSRMGNLGLLFLFISPIGCGPSSAAFEEKIRGLEKEISQLRSEKVNLEARAGALDDRVVVLDKKLRRCGEEKSPLLSVVRLSPEAEAPQASQMNRLDDSNEHFEGDEAEEGQRPVLVLRGFRGTGAGYEKSLQASREDFSSFGPENLGVVNPVESENSPSETSSVPGEMDLFNEAYRAYSNRNYEQALEAFSEFVKENPEHPYADNALYWRGECYLASREFFKGIGEFERLLRRYPKSDSAPSSLYKIGFSYDQLNDRTKAVEYYFQVVDKFPHTDAARRASQRVSALERRNSRSEKRVVPTNVER